ncbi:YfhD family protein [Halalkalibacter okhensis]|nr:YfhD family protein [Halalkalibacter okhensis]
MNKNNPQGQYDEVEYSEELADTKDKEAMTRMEQADKRAQKRNRKSQK